MKTARLLMLYRSLLLALVLVLAAVLPAVGQPTTYNWQGGTGDWGEPHMWEPAGPPDPSSSVNISSGNPAITIDAQAGGYLRLRDTSNLTVGGVGLNPTLTIGSEGSTAASGLNSNMIVGSGSNDAPTVTQNTGTVQVAGRLILGDDPGSQGRYNLSGGSLTVTGSWNTTSGTPYYAPGYITVGQGGTGTLNIGGSGANPSLTAGSAGSEGSGLDPGQNGNPIYMTVGAQSGSVGRVNQSDGTVQLYGNLTLGQEAGSQGSYTLNGGSLNVAGYWYNSSKWFDDREGEEGSSGHYEYYGWKNNGRMAVGQGGSGTFTHNSGSVSVGDLILGGTGYTNNYGSSGEYLGTSLSPGNGAYNLSGSAISGDSHYSALLVTGTTHVGQGGTGIFTQTGGLNQTGGLILGESSFQPNFDVNGNYAGYSLAQGNGAYTLNAPATYDSQGFPITNLLVTGDTLIGDGGTGIFNQQSGVHQIMGSLILGQVEGFGYDSGSGQYIKVTATGVGTYNLGGGSLNVAASANPYYYAYGSLVVGQGGTGYLNIGGSGANPVLTAGSEGSPGGGLDPGQNGNPVNMTVGAGSLGQVNQSDGTVQLAGNLTLAQGAGSVGSYALNGGSLKVTGQWNNFPNWVVDNPETGEGHYEYQGWYSNGSIVVGQGGAGTLNIGGSGANPSLTAGSEGFQGDNSNPEQNGHQTSMTVGAQAGSVGRVNQSNGTVQLAGTLTLGQEAGSVGSYTLNGGSLRVTGSWQTIQDWLPDGETGHVENRVVYNIGSMVVGQGGSGTFTHNRGSVSVKGDLTLGGNWYGYGPSSGSGTYNLSGSANPSDAGCSTLNVTGTTHVGQTGTGTFTQTGGSHQTGRLILGEGYVQPIFDGETGYTLVQGNGTYTLNAPTADGLKNLLVNGDTLIGSGGSGTFNHQSGIHQIMGSLTLGQDQIRGVESKDRSGLYYVTVPGTGAYTLSGSGKPWDPNYSALLVTGTTHAGQTGTGIFTQTGGFHQTSGLILGESYFQPNFDFYGNYTGYSLAQGNGAYTLNAPTSTANVLNSLLVNGDTLIGSGGNGTFNHQSGVQEITGNLVLGQNQNYWFGYQDGSGQHDLNVTAAGNGTYNLSGSANLGDSNYSALNVGGSISVGGVGAGGGTVMVTQAGTDGETGSGSGGGSSGTTGGGTGGIGAFHQTGGRVSVTNALNIGTTSDVTGTYTMGQGVLTTQDLIVGSPGNANDPVTGTFTITSAQAQVSVGGDFTINPRGEFRDTAGVTITLTGSDVKILSNNVDMDQTTLFFANPEDADNLDVQVANFHLGGLKLTEGADVALTGNDLYVDTLDLGNGCTLDLNNFKLYYRTEIIEPGATVTFLDGTPQAVPLPGTLPLLVSGLLGLGVLRRFRKG